MGPESFSARPTPVTLTLLAGTSKDEDCFPKTILPWRLAIQSSVYATIIHDLTKVTFGTSITTRRLPSRTLELLVLTYRYVLDIACFFPTPNRTHLAQRGAANTTLVVESCKAIAKYSFCLPNALPQPRLSYLQTEASQV
jgi:hypothetical protein